MLHDVLYVPKLAYNLISVTKVSQKGKIIKFTMSTCYVVDKRYKMVAKAGSLYQLNHKANYECVNVAGRPDTKENIWHKHYGHLGISNF